ncbi:hypothetical protein [Kosakonia oryzae]|uniref:hypothetical protein n=1 Tax=Kosakonia oryzae TaxID=497725 RepID=UPI001D0701B9|nr:hypothetical protein [Kosakonia oryzae]UDJ83462.1 hypothetical protein I5186_05005 [Kosakonia oryzae]
MTISIALDTDNPDTSDLLMQFSLKRQEHHLQALTSWGKERCKHPYKTNHSLFEIPVNTASVGILPVSDNR